MRTAIDVNNKPIILLDPKAIRMVKRMAIADHRNFSNALVVTVYEALADKYGDQIVSGSTGQVGGPGETGKRQETSGKIEGS